MVASLLKSVQGSDCKVERRPCEQISPIIASSLPQYLLPFLPCYQFIKHQQDINGHRNKEHISFGKQAQYRKHSTQHHIGVPFFIVPEPIRAIEKIQYPEKQGVA